MQLIFYIGLVRKFAVPEVSQKSVKKRYTLCGIEKERSEQISKETGKQGNIQNRIVGHYFAFKE
jgi:hypothetical protein